MLLIQEKSQNTENFNIFKDDVHVRQVASVKWSFMRIVGWIYKIKSLNYFPIPQSRILCVYEQLL